MKRLFITFNAFIKGLVFLIRPHLFLGWMKNFLLFSSNLLSLTRWMSAQERKQVLNDFYSPRRDYSKRYQLYQYITDQLNLSEQPIDYLEFGVSQGESFRWWVANSPHADTRFYGFDTFEGLPENFGTYNKGDMAAGIPQINDPRAKFVKGLFQDSLPSFLADHNLQNGKRKLIHLDADLFSATVYTLTTLSPYLKKGDILLFDEFNVPTHEFHAFKIFTESFYVKTKLVGAVNNYLQVALTIE